MTEQSFIENFIEVTEHERSDGTVVQATMKCGAGTFVPAYLSQMQRIDAMKQAKEHCIEQVLRMLYVDRRSEFSEALCEFMRGWHRMNYSISDDSEKKLFECVKRMAPTWADKRLGAK